MDQTALTLAAWQYVLRADQPVTTIGDDQQRRSHPAFTQEKSAQASVDSATRPGPG